MKVADVFQKMELQTQDVVHMPCCLSFNFIFALSGIMPLPQ